MAGYRLHEVLVAPARPTAQLGRIIGGVVLIVFGFIALNVLFFQIMRLFPGWSDLAPHLSDGTVPMAIWVLLLNFAPLLLSLAIVLHVLHSRSVVALLGPRRLVLFDTRRVLRRAVPLYLVIFLIPLPDALAAEWNMSLSAWLVLLPLSVPLLILQVTTEEVLFRGYLQSHLAARSSSPLVWMLVPSALFAFLHYDPETFGPNALALAGVTGLFALAAADLTARAGNLGPALALHFINNVVALLVTSMDGYWDGLALFTVPYDPSNVEAVQGSLPIEVLVIFCGWLVARIAIRR